LELSELLKFTAKKGASDLHLKPMRPPLLRLNGKMIPLKTESLSPKDLEGMLLPILTPLQRERLEHDLAVDVGYGLQGVARFRANIYTQRGSLAASFRRIPFKLPTIDDLELPAVLESFAHLPAGLVIVTGPTGSGKSTTLAAIMREIT
jgi:twitching motility protein PilT